MPRQQSWAYKLAELDVTMPLATAGLMCCGIGYFFGVGAAFWAVVYGFIGLLVIGMPLLLFFAWHAEMEQLRSLRRQHGGRLRRGWPHFGGPSLSFLHDGMQATVRLIRRGQSYRPGDMEVGLQWPGPPIRLEVRPQGVVSLLGGLVGFEDIKVGSASFDDAYFVRGEYPDQVSRLLTRNVQHQIIKLPEQKYLVISLNRGRLTVRAQHYSLNSNIDEFTEAVLRLYDALRNSTQTLLNSDHTHPLPST